MGNVNFIVTSFSICNVLIMKWISVTVIGENKTVGIASNFPLNMASKRCEICFKLTLKAPE